MLAGYTGNKAVWGMFFANAAQSTGTDLYNWKGNYGAIYSVYGDTNGINVGSLSTAQSGSKNIAYFAESSLAKNNATNIGIYTMVNNTGTAGIQIGGLFTLQKSSSFTYPTASCALICDNVAQTSDIFQAMDNGVIKVRIIDGGSIVIPSNVPSSSTDTGTAGQFGWDANYIYVCVSSNYWKRAVLEDFPNTGLTDAALTENGFNILLETGDKLLLNP
jgi:hypothetical protein